MTRVYVDGQEGTTGLQIHERLGGRSDIELLTINPALRKDSGARAKLLRAADIAFLCLPDDAAREAVKLAEGSGVRILDASTAHRVAEGWTYGLPELSAAQCEAIRNAQRVAVPGCHATGFISLIAPLVKSGILPADAPVSCHSITGYSGGGRKMIQDYESPERADEYSSTRVYALGLRHKHLPEMRHYTGLDSPPLFDPILGDFAQGMLVCVPLMTRLLRPACGAADVREALAAHYQGSRFVKVMPFAPDAPPDGGFLNPMALNGTNHMQLFVFGDEQQALLIARLDNLGKGASGAAVQCMNIMLGLPEDTGLA